MKTTKKLSIFAFSALLAACQPKAEPMESEENNSTTAVAEESTKEMAYNTEDVHSMLRAIAAANGGMEQLRANKNVQYDYYYLKPDSTIDISQERYIFEDETSWAKYTTHEVNVVPDMEGDIVQYYDGTSAICYANGNKMEDPEAVGMGQFLRQANYMWFNMMFKFTDPGVLAAYNGQLEYEGKTYDIIAIDYDSTVTGKAQNDRYVLYVNPETHLVDYFYFSLPLLGVNDPVLWAELTYEEIDGVQVVVHRGMYAPNPETGERSMMVDQTLKNISFNNNFTKEDLATSI